MSTPFEPQPCCGGGEIPVPLDVNVVSPNPLPVTGTVSVNEPVDVNLVSPNPLPVTGTVAVSNLSEPLDVNVVSPLPLNVNVVSPNPLPVTGTLSVGGSTAASATLTTATTGNGTTVDFTSARSNVSLFVQVNGTVTTGVVDLQASQDGTNWVKIAATAALATGVNQHLTLDGGAFRWFRGVVSETVVGGGTVTATLMFA